MYRFLVIAALIASAFIAGAQETTIKGSLTVDGKVTPLTHALALDFKDIDGMSQGDEVRVLLSDREIAPTELESSILFNLDALAREGKLSGVVLRFDPKSESPEVYGTAYAAIANAQSAMPFFTLGGDAGGADSLKSTGGSVTGTLAYGAEGDADFGIPAWSFEVAFTTPLKACSPVTELKGAEAIGTPQFKTYIQFEEAMRKGDLATVRKMTTPEKAKQMDEFIAQAGEEQFKAMTKEMTAEPAAREQALHGLFVRGDRTTIVFNDEGGKMSVSLVKKGDGWIMD